MNKKIEDERQKRYERVSLAAEKMARAMVKALKSANLESGSEEMTAIAYCTASYLYSFGKHNGADFADVKYAYIETLNKIEDLMKEIDAKAGEEKSN